MEPKKKTDGGEGSLHDPLHRNWLRLGEIINLARGATTDLKRDWPPPEPWLDRFKDLKAAVEYGKLRVAQPPILVSKSTSVSLENLSAFALGQDALWDWLRDFCQRWADARGIVLEEQALKEALNTETAVPPESGQTEHEPSAAHPNRRGRKKGVGGYDSTDLPLIEEMHHLIKSGKATSQSNAALMVVHDARGTRDVPNKVKRLVGKYAANYGPDEGHSV